MLLLFFVVSLIPSVFSASCESPRATSSGYSTLDGFFHFSTTCIVEFNLQCANDVKNIPLYAVINGKSYPVSVCVETGKYQVSWRLEHAQASKQTFDINIYDEDKFANYKAAESNGEDASSVKPLITVSHYHAGISKKWPISAEFVFIAASIVALYYAGTFKSQLKN